jgi:hypothetical protein
MSMIGARVTFDREKLRVSLTAEAEKLKRMARRASNELAFRARAEIQAEMRRAFDRPTPFVVNGMRVVYATEDSGDAALVDWKLESAGGAGAGRTLRPQIEGGTRATKRFEKLLGVPAGMVAVPARGARLDRYGNLRPAEIVQIISDLRAFSEVGFRANRAAGKKGKYFIIRGAGGGRLRPGVYERRKSGPRMIVAFVRATAYRPRFAPAEVARRVVRDQAGEVWRLAMERRLPFRRAGADS